MSITEEATETNIKKLIADMPDNLIPIERVILCNEGTVQTLLSVIFREPVKVQVISQHEFANIIVRWTRLFVEYPGVNESVTVCLAESVITKDGNSQEFLSDIREKKMGIGQIIKACKLNTERLLLGFYVDDMIFARNYSVLGDCNIVLTEVFPREIFKK